MTLPFIWIIQGIYPVKRNDFEIPVEDEVEQTRQSGLVSDPSGQQRCPILQIGNGDILEVPFGQLGTDLAFYADFINVTLVGCALLFS